MSHDRFVNTAMGLTIALALGMCFGLLAATDHPSDYQVGVSIAGAYILGRLHQWFVRLK